MIPSRLLSIDQASAYCNLSKSGFRSWVQDGRLPGPIKGTRRWDKKAIDRALDRASGLPQDSSPRTELEKWLIENRPLE